MATIPHDGQPDVYLNSTRHGRRSGWLLRAGTTLLAAGSMLLGGAATLTDVTGADGCVFDYTSDQRLIDRCTLSTDVAAGATSVVTVQFQSPSKPLPYARIAPEQGSVDFDGVTTDFAAVFRSTTGSLRHPRPYVQDSTAALSVTATYAALTPQADGTFAGPLTVTVHNNGDAPQTGLAASIVLPVGLSDELEIEPSGMCFGTGDQEDTYGCTIDGPQLADGQTRTFDLIIHAPADTPTTYYGSGSLTVTLTGPAAAQTDSANMTSFAVVLAD